MYFSKHLAAAAAACIFCMTSALAETYTVGDLTIESPQARATAPQSKVGGGYMMITNNGTQSDRLIAASALFASKVEIHEMKMDGDVMRMRELENGIEIPPGETVLLKPGGLHVMFMGLKEQLKAGEKRKTVLNFEKAGEIEVDFSVEKIVRIKGDATKAMDHSKMDHSKMDHGKMKHGE